MVIESMHILQLHFNTLLIILMKSYWDGIDRNLHNTKRNMQQYGQVEIPE